MIFYVLFQGSDASSIIFPSALSARKHEFPGALPPSLPHGPGSSPVPAPTPPNLPAPSPAPAQQPPHHLPQAIPCAAVAPVVGESASLGGAAQPMVGAAQPQAPSVKPEVAQMGAKVPPVSGQGELHLNSWILTTTRFDLTHQIRVLVKLIAFNR